MFSALTTRVSGNARWICSARLSSPPTEQRGGKPPEKSSGLATSTRTLPASASAPAARRASSEWTPEVQLTTRSAKAAASAKVPVLADDPADAGPGVAPARAAVEREPMPHLVPDGRRSAVPSVSPTDPVPSTPILIADLALGGQ